MTYTTKKFANNGKTSLHDYMIRRQNVNYERFIQEKADVFQVTDHKDQAMFWVQNLLTH